MNSKILISTCLILFSIHSFSQESTNETDEDIKERQTNFKVGILGGVNSSTMTNDLAIIAPESKFDLNAGISFQYDFSKNISLESDLIYSIKGFQNVFDLTDMNGNYLGEASYQLKTSYLCLPFLFKYNFGNKITISPMFGPYFSILFAAKEINDVLTDVYEYTIDVGDDLKPFDMGLTAGFGLEIPIKKIDIGLDVRYNLGMSNLYLNPGFVISKNKSLSLNLGLKFNLGDGWTD